MIKELEIVVLRRDLPDRKLKAGDVGTVVLAHREGEGFEVEFTTLVGDTVRNGSSSSGWSGFC